LRNITNIYSWSLTAIKIVQAKRMRRTGHVACMAEMRNEYILVRKPEGKRPLGKPTRRWENNIKSELKEKSDERVDWIHRDQDRDH
jgi:hypothetical protein